MAKIAIALRPPRGHYNATIRLADMLRSSGHRIVYLAYPNYELEIKKRGHEFYPINPFIIPTIKYRKLETRPFYLKNINSALKDSIFKEAYQNFQSLDLFIRAHNPDVVLLDETIPMNAFLFELFRIKVVLIRSSPEPKRHELAPPFNYHFIPGLSRYSQLVCACLWFLVRFRGLTSYLISRYIYFRQDEWSILKRLALLKGHKIDFKKIDFEVSVGFSVNGLPRIMLSPCGWAFNIREPKAPKNTFYIGPLPDINRDSIIEDDRYIRVRKSVIQKRQSGVPIIYASMGTLTASEIQKTLLFFAKLFIVARLNPSDAFVLSLGHYIDPEQLGLVPANVALFTSLPQCDLLSYCDVAILNGGMNSITECIMVGVPMLIYPLSMKWDQPSNSAKVVYHKLGLRGTIDKDSPAVMSSKLRELKSDYKRYKERLFEMKGKFENNTRTTDPVKLIESFI